LRNGRERVEPGEDVEGIQVCQKKGERGKMGLGSDWKGGGDGGLEGCFHFGKNENWERKIFDTSRNLKNKRGSAGCTIRKKENLKEKKGGGGGWVGLRRLRERRESNQNGPQRGL